MTATAISYSDWYVAWMDDIRRRIDELAAVAANQGPTCWLHAQVAAAKESWLAGKPAETELILFNAGERIRQEREWEAQTLITAIWAPPL
jgi:hypothetical protein